MPRPVQPCSICADPEKKEAFDVLVKKGVGKRMMQDSLGGSIQTIDKHWYKCLGNTNPYPVSSSTMTKARMQVTQVHRLLDDFSVSKTEDLQKRLSTLVCDVAKECYRLIGEARSLGDGDNITPDFKLKAISEQGKVINALTSVFSLLARIVGVDKSATQVFLSQASMSQPSDMEAILIVRGLFNRSGIQVPVELEYLEKWVMDPAFEPPDVDRTVVTEAVSLPQRQRCPNCKEFDYIDGVCQACGYRQ